MKKTPQQPNPKSIQASADREEICNYVSVTDQPMQWTGVGSRDAFACKKKIRGFRRMISISQFVDPVKETSLLSDISFDLDVGDGDFNGYDDGDSDSDSDDDGDCDGDIGDDDNDVNDVAVMMMMMTKKANRTSRQASISSSTDPLGRTQQSEPTKVLK